MIISSWISDNYIEVFGAITGIIYVFLEIRQNIWLWPVGIVTSAVYILVFFTSKFYADMSLQGYYLIISVIGWYWWRKGLTAQRLNGATAEKERGCFDFAQHEGEGETEDQRPETEDGRPETEDKKGRRGEGETDYRLQNTDHRIPNDTDKEVLIVTRLKLKTGLILGAVFVLLYTGMWLVLSKLTDSPVPEWDAFITSLSVVATWMLARKIYEHWYLWIIVNFVSAVLFMSRGLYPTVILYLVYGVMSFAGLIAWKKSISRI